MLSGYLTQASERVVLSLTTDSHRRPDMLIIFLLLAVLAVAGYGLAKAFQSMTGSVAADMIDLYEGRF